MRVSHIVQRGIKKLLLVAIALVCTTHISFAAATQTEAAVKKPTSAVTKYSFKKPMPSQKKSTSSRTSDKPSTSSNKKTKKTKKKVRNKYHASKHYIAQIHPNAPMVTDEPSPGFMASIEQRMIGFVH